jgi:hypothetical protein
MGKFGTTGLNGLGRQDLIDRADRSRREADRVSGPARAALLRRARNYYTEAGLTAIALRCERDAAAATHTRDERPGRPG